MRDLGTVCGGTNESCFRLDGGHHEDATAMCLPFTQIGRKLLHILNTISLARDYLETSRVSAWFSSAPGPSLCGLTLYHHQSIVPYPLSSRFAERHSQWHPRKVTRRMPRRRRLPLHPNYDTEPASSPHRMTLRIHVSTTSSHPRNRSTVTRRQSIHGKSINLRPRQCLRLVRRVR